MAKAPGPCVVATDDDDNLLDTCCDCGVYRTCVDGTGCVDD